ncbi:MAG: hypothetical protein H6861_06195 [Rhodospirillales bacterium]|nr:hypothetical protein [Rhodospirillales bacterium]
MRAPFLLTLFCLLPALLGACSHDEQTAEPLTPIDDRILDPDDQTMARAVHEFLQSVGAPVASTYNYARFDLNGDNRREAIVLFKTPYGYWCDQHGCTMLVLRAHNDHFSLVNAIQPVREPVYIAPVKTKGWNNLVLRVSGRWDAAKDVAMLYNGRQYPENPARQPAFFKDNDDDYIRILYE